MQLAAEQILKTSKETRDRQIQNICWVQYFSDCILMSSCYCNPQTKADLLKISLGHRFTYSGMPFVSFWGTIESGNSKRSHAAMLLSMLMKEWVGLKRFSHPSHTLLQDCSCKKSLAVLGHTALLFHLCTMLLHISGDEEACMASRWTSGILRGIDLCITQNLGWITVACVWQKSHNICDISWLRWRSINQTGAFYHPHSYCPELLIDDIQVWPPC